MALIDALMVAYTSDVITIERVVQAVRYVQYICTVYYTRGTAALWLRVRVLFFGYDGHYVLLLKLQFFYVCDRLSKKMFILSLPLYGKSIFTCSAVTLHNNTQYPVTSSFDD